MGADRSTARRQKDALEMLLTGWCRQGIAGQRLSLRPGRSAGHRGCPSTGRRIPVPYPAAGQCYVRPCPAHRLSSERHQQRRLPPVRTSRRHGDQTQPPSYSAFGQTPTAPSPHGAPGRPDGARGTGSSAGKQRSPVGAGTARLPQAALRWGPATLP